MKIAIAGPVFSDEVTGGVASFTEGIFQAFSNKSNLEVKLFTKINKNSLPYNSEVIACNSYMDLKKCIKNYSPDIVMSSLQYSFYLRSMRAIKIHFVHGFTSLRYYPFYKFFGMILSDKFIYQKFTYKIANSSFTKLINEQIYNNKIDEVINIGLPESILNSSRPIKKDNENISRNLIYVGRLVKAKNIDLIIKSIQSLNETSKFEYQLTVIGSGPEEDYLKSIAKGETHFIGEVKNSELNTFYNKNDIFISLNNHEPFGIVYLEALLNSCKIVCPNTGGQLDFLNDYKENVEFVDISSIENIAEGIENIRNKKFQEIDQKKIKIQFSYDRYIEKLLKLLGEF